jgi:molybdopterin-containing oxidoreductase family membrane subunit
MMVGIFFMRYDLVLAGQIVPVFHGLHVEEYSNLLTYIPSFHEISVVVAGILVAIVLFLGGEKVLNAHKFQKHAIVPPGGFICPGCGGIHYKKEGETEEDALKRHHRMRKVEREDEHA